MIIKNQLSVVDGKVRKFASSPQQSVAGITAKKTTANMDGFADTQTVGYFGANQFQKQMQGILPEASEETLIPYYRDIYYNDSIGGSACDLTATFPYSDWTLSGVESDRAAVYTEALARLNMRTLINEITLHYLVDGDFIGTLVYDKDIRNFSDIFIHDRAYCRVLPSPFYATRSIIQASQSARLAQFRNSGSKYTDLLLEGYPQELIKGLEGGLHDLNPLLTLHVQRRSLADTMSGSTSYLKRLLPTYLLEKTLYRGTLIEAARRQRATTHITVGDGSWEPTYGEMQSVLQQFQSTDLDPLGAWIVTRQGVSVSDVRQAGDMWKWTEAVEGLTNIKLRALGISEAFLSGDANFSCLTADALLPTSNGLVRIGNMGTGLDKTHRQKVRTTTVDSRFGPEKVSSWIYQGLRQTYKVTTKQGNAIKATGNHPVLVFNGKQTEWKRVDKLETGDLLCVSRNKVTRQEPLRLKVPYPVAREQREVALLNAAGTRRGMNPGSHQSFEPGEFKQPSVMTPKLAYWLALFISEGCCHGKNNDQGVARFEFANTDVELNRRFAVFAKELFGVETSTYGGSMDNLLATKPCYTIAIRNRRLADWMESIGVYMTPGSVDGLRPSFYKNVPWSVLEADEESQRAFLAGYAECDGNVSGTRTSFFSASYNTAAEILAMLNSHGYQSVMGPRSNGSVNGLYRIDISREDSDHFWHTMDAQRYLASKEVHQFTEGKYSKLAGVPSKAWIDFVDSRKVKFDRHGGYYKTDAGETICWSRNSCDIAMFDQRFNYTRYKEGAYDDYLDFLHQLSPKAHQALVTVLECGYRFTEIVSIEDNGKDHVYDISMQAGKEPAFVANGLVVHNTSESAVATFIENVLALRNFMTYKIFTSTLFPLIAVANGLYREGSKRKEITSPEAILYDVSHHKDLDIPTLLWSKDLIGSDAPSKMELLDVLAEKGFPIALRTYASAAGLDVGALLNDVKEDEALKEQFKKLGVGVTGDPDPDNDAMDAYASFGRSNNEGTHSARQAFSILSGGLHKVGVGNRSMEPDVHQLSKTGKKKAIFGEHRHMKKENDLLVAASQRLADPMYLAKVQERNRKRYGGSIPNIFTGGRI